MITPNYPPEKNKMVMTVALISLSIVVSGLYGIFTVRHCPLESLNYFLKFLRAMVISGMSLLFVEFIIYSSIWHLIKASKYANKI